MSTRAASVLSLLIVLSSTSQAASAVALQAGSPELLKAQLLDTAEKLLLLGGWFVDRASARLSSSRPLPTDGTLMVRPLWRSGEPASPLMFEARAAGDRSPANIALAVVLQREVWVAARHLAKGSAVTCPDVTAERRNSRIVSQGARTGPCELGAGTVALHDLGPRDIIADRDLGKAFDVATGSPVNVTASSAGVRVAVTGTALTDARVGDVIQVRLPRPMRILRARVTGPGSAELLEGGL